MLLFDFLMVSFMKIINLNTNVIFDLPKSDAEQLLKVAPEIFAKVSKNKKIIKCKKDILSEDSVLSKILDE